VTRSPWARNRAVSSTVDCITEEVNDSDCR
jgi:hypothetical protein